MVTKSNSPANEGLFDFFKKKPRQPDVKKKMPTPAADTESSTFPARRDYRRASQRITIYGLPLSPIDVRLILDAAFKLYEVVTDLSKRGSRNDPVVVSYSGKARITALPRQLMVERYDEKAQELYVREAYGQGSGT